MFRVDAAWNTVWLTKKGLSVKWQKKPKPNMNGYTSVIRPVQQRKS